jgi:SSS family transporter
MRFTDYAVLTLYLLMVLGIGLYFRVSQGNHSDYFLAGRSMGWFPIGLSVMVTVFSAINYVALPNEVFGYGLYVTVALPVFFLAAWPITRIWMPFFNAMQLTSAYEYLERRFDGRVRCLASGLFISWRLFWMATALYASGQILAVLTGLSTPAVIFTCGLVATAYTAVGGMRAVMWTDVAQFCVLFGGIALGLALAGGESGLAEIFAVAREGGRLKPFLPFDPQFLSLNPFIRMTLWSGFLGVLVAFMARYGADQVVMQRYFTARNLSAAQRGLWFSALVSVISLTLLALFGLAVYTHAVKAGVLAGISWESLPPLQKKSLAMGQLAAVIRAFPAGVTGLVAAGLLAATMSSIDSGINACSAAWMVDFHPRLFRPAAAGKQSIAVIDRRLTLALGVLSTAMALSLIVLIGPKNSLFMIVNKMINALGSPLLALLTLGMFSHRVNAPGMLSGGLVGIVASLAISLTVSRLALQYYAVANLLVTVAACYLFSYIFIFVGHEQPAGAISWTWWARRDRN